MNQSRDADLTSWLVDSLPPVQVGPGCTRIDLPGAPGARTWVVDIGPGSQWPHVDFHNGPEQFFVVSGELIEDERRYGPGSYLFFAPGSSHRPRTETGVRLFGFNVLEK